MGRLRRLDSELVRRKLVASRTQAAKIIAQGRVYLDGQQVLKPARQLDPAQAIVIKEGERPDYASRGGYKLAGVLEVLGEQAPEIKGKACLDAGASTGGFTDVLLRNGARKVAAVDVGYGQLRWELQQDPRVEVHDRTNVRTLTPAQLSELPELIVSDLSFISLTLVLPALYQCGQPGAEYLLMVKPQFEVGKSQIGKGGVVRDPQAHFQAVTKVIRAALDLGLKLRAVAASPLPGPAGNVEYFVYLTKSAQDVPTRTGEATSVPNAPVQAELASVDQRVSAQIESLVWQAIWTGPAQVESPSKPTEGSQKQTGCALEPSRAEV